jgi:hypothetical protein
VTFGFKAFVYQYSLATSPWQNFGKQGDHWAWVGLIATAAANALQFGFKIGFSIELTVV